ncbi:Holliday junction resolvase RuvX [Patescibacteria group bacterium]|nr:Holliday junction resolvase RuvX [Patescibacteria group bacterium]
MNSPLLGLDLGFRRTGVAISENGLLARPLTVIRARPPHMQVVVEAVIQLVNEHKIATLVIGLPYTEDDRLTSQALKVERIISQIDSALAAQGMKPEIKRINEFHTSLDAAAIYPEAPLDAAAAALILQDYIDQHA